MIHTARHTAKFTKLVRRIRTALPGLPVDPSVVATGILEQLWHFAITSAKRGDIGQHDDELIAEACGWIGDPSEFISILTETGWVDHCDQHRLVVHDWHEHAPAFIKRNIDRVGGFVCAGKQALPCSDEQVSGRLTAQNTVQDATPNVTQRNQTNNVRTLAVPTSERIEVTDKVYADCRDRLRQIHDVVDKGRKLLPQDRKLAIHAAVMARERLGEGWLDDLLASHKIRRGAAQNRWAYFAKACQKSAEQLGVDWHGEVKRIVIPEGLLNGRPVQEASA